MPPIDFALQADLTVPDADRGRPRRRDRAGARDPRSSAGMRTHLLVSLGSAIFTELSIYGFSGPGSDGAPSRPVAGRGADRDRHRLPRSGRDHQVRDVGPRAHDGGQPVDGGRDRDGRPAPGVAHRGRRDVHRAGLALAAERARRPAIHKPGQNAIRLRLEVGRLEALGDVSQLLATGGWRWPGSTASGSARGATRSSSNSGSPSGRPAKDIIGAITSIPDVELMESATHGD